jgi:hypothetical protein
MTDARPPHRTDPDVLALVERYRGHPATAGSIWDAAYLDGDLDMARFRADNVYLWQERDGNDARALLLTAEYLATRDHLGLLSRLAEDGAFGAETLGLRGRRVSRDLLDSVSELLFLDAHVGLSGRTVLDVGAGYGRFAWRLTEAFADARILATDAVPESTALARFYLAHRGASSRAEVVPLDEIEARALAARPTLLTNMHSFTEMPLAAVRWWLTLAAHAGVEWCFIVPNADAHGGAELCSYEGDETRLPIAPVLSELGFELVLAGPKFGDEKVQRYGVSPTWYWLFWRNGAGHQGRAPRSPAG